MQTIFSPSKLEQITVNYNFHFIFLFQQIEKKSVVGIHISFNPQKMIKRENKSILSSKDTQRNVYKDLCVHSQPQECLINIFPVMSADFLKQKELK